MAVLLSRAPASPFVHGAAAAGGRPLAPPPPAASAAHQHDGSLRRCPSRTLSSQPTLQLTRGRCRCCAISETLELAGSAAVSSFEDVCEALGDIAKLDNVVGSGLKAAASAAVGAPLGGGGAVGWAAHAMSALHGFDGGAALGWGVEKVVASLGEVSLLEGVMDKALLDLFQQCFGALELAGSAFDTPALRLAVAGCTALAVRAALERYRAAHPAALQRQLSPAASLSDAMAEAATATLLSAAGVASPAKQQQAEQQPKQRTQRQGTLAFAGAFAGGSMLERPAAAASSVVRPLASVGLAQFKRHNKLRRKVAAVASEVACAGRWSPAAAMVVIEAAAVAHSYSELAQGLSTLLRLGAS